MRIVLETTGRVFEAKARLDVMAIGDAWYLRHPPFRYYEPGMLGATFARDYERNADHVCSCRETGCRTQAHIGQDEIDLMWAADSNIEPIAAEALARVRAARRRAERCVANNIR